MTNCDSRDQDLLMLAHNQLPPIRRILTERHLRGCAQCSERASQFRSVSRHIASALREPELGPFRVPHAGLLASVPAALLVAIVLTAALITTGVIVAVNHHNAARAVASPSGQCRPDLPNAACQ